MLKQLFKKLKKISIEIEIKHFCFYYIVFGSYSTSSFLVVIRQIYTFFYFFRAYFESL